MGRRPQDPVRALTVAEQEVVERLIKAERARRDQVRRALALRAVAQGVSYIEAAERAGYQDEESVSRLVRRFNARGLGALTIAAGRGRTVTYGVPERACIGAVVRRTPDREQDGAATWSLALLARAVRDEGVSRSGATTIRRVLRAAGSSSQRTRTWCPTGTALRTRTEGTVRVVDPQAEEKRGASSRRTG